MDSPFLGFGRDRAIKKAFSHSLINKPNENALFFFMDLFTALRQPTLCLPISLPELLRTDGQVIQPQQAPSYPGIQSRERYF